MEDDYKIDVGKCNSLAYLAYVEAALIDLAEKAREKYGPAADTLYLNMLERVRGVIEYTKRM